MTLIAMIMKFVFLLFLVPVACAQVCEQDSDCLNGGKCEETTSGSDITHSNTGSLSYCQCASNYHGSKCDKYCPISCHNGGTCKNVPTEHATTSSSLFQDYQCRCRSGWKGIQCDIRVHKCPDNILECFNGATCRVSDDNDDAPRITYACVCPYTHDGFQCEHPVAIETCADGHECVNGGTCTPTSDTDVGKEETSDGSPSIRYMCQCPDSHFGDYCQTKVEMAKTANGNEGTAASNTGIVIAGMMMGVILLMLGVVVIIRIRKRHRTCNRSTNVVVGVLEADGSTMHSMIGVRMENEAHARRDAATIGKHPVEHESDNEVI